MARGRKRIAIGSKGEAIVARAIKNGTSAERLVAELAAARIKISTRTAGERLREARGPVRATRSDRRKAAAKGALHGALVSATEDRDETGSSGVLDTVGALADRGAREAAKDGNLPMVGAMARLKLRVSEAQRKSTMPEPPSDDVDMNELAQLAVLKLEDMVLQILGPARSDITEPRVPAAIASTPKVILAAETDVPVSREKLEQLGARVNAGQTLEHACQQIGVPLRAVRSGEEMIAESVERSYRQSGSWAGMPRRGDGGRI